MNTGIAAFYATSATTIPVLLVIYLVQLRGWLKRSNDLQRERLADIEAGRLDDIEFRSLVIHGAKLLITTVSWIWPVWAEVVCFVSLAEENSAPGGTLVVASGLLTAGVVALGPLMYVSLVEPQIISGRLLRALINVVREERQAEKEIGAATHHE